jgi:uncharacterized Fe-S cluster-containing protein
MELLTHVTLPGLNCGVCGYRSCEEFSKAIDANPDLLKRCLYLDKSIMGNRTKAKPQSTLNSCPSSCVSCEKTTASNSWKDTLGRDFDFILDLFPNDPGPRETILPHNPLITRELNIQPGEVLIGRPLGMSCGCPVTHCGIVMEADHKAGVIVWCVTGPLSSRRGAFKDLGYYSAQAYDGIVRTSKPELKIGMRYWFMPHKCMLQWRHSGLVNFLNQTPDGLQVRLEGLMIG